MTNDRHDTSDRGESLAEFKDSFFYGSRSDLDVKFLADLSPSEAGRFLAEMLAGIAGMLDDGDPEPVISSFIDWQRRAYGGHGEQKARFTYDEGPFTSLTKPLKECRVALVTSSGHFVAGDDPRPFGVTNMSQAEAEDRIAEFLRAEPVLSVIPADTGDDDLRVRHGGYPVAGAWRDHRVVFPLDNLRTLAAQGAIGEVAPNAYSFVGAAAQLRLRDHTASEWAQRLRAEDVDAVLLVPV